MKKTIFSIIGRYPKWKITLRKTWSLLAIFFFILTKCAAQTITIDSQTWMTKNLNVDKFRNGDPIPEAKTREEWSEAGDNKQPAWCYYDNDLSNGTKYGKLYNWYAINDPRGLAPLGWHIPSDDEWSKLIDYIGNDYVAVNKLKSATGWKTYSSGGSKTCPNCSSWNAEYRSKVPCHICKDTRVVPAPIIKYNYNGNNHYGFAALPGGGRGNAGSFYFLGIDAFWWTSTESNVDKAWNRSIEDNASITRFPNSKDVGMSVRCVRD